MSNATPTPEMIAFAEQYHREKVKYNGWTNRATWLVSLEFASDYIETLAGDGETFATVNALADRIKSEAADIVTMTFGGMEAGLVEGWALLFLAGVDWHQIAENAVDAWPGLIVDPEMDAAGLQPDDDCFQ